ncbi:MAG: hypothetical protein JKY56_24400, partial [Kofleriaceae bacterium]|nr:hypothetical protein [Kofleriaceae bacterium]
MNSGELNFGAKPRVWLLMVLFLGSMGCNDGDEARFAKDNPVQACGDSVLDTGEACDDGNISDGDGCSNDCLSDE